MKIKKTTKSGVRRKPNQWQLIIINNKEKIDQIYREVCFWRSNFTMARKKIPEENFEIKQRLSSHTTD